MAGFFERKRESKNRVIILNSMESLLAQLIVTAV